MNLKIAVRPQQGSNKIFDVGEYGMKLTKFGFARVGYAEQNSAGLAE